MGGPYGGRKWPNRCRVRQIVYLRLHDDPLGTLEKILERQVEVGHDYLPVADCMNSENARITSCCSLGITSAM